MMRTLVWVDSLSMCRKPCLEGTESGMCLFARLLTWYLVNLNSGCFFFFPLKFRSVEITKKKKIQMIFNTALQGESGKGRKYFFWKPRTHWPVVCHHESHRHKTHVRCHPPLLGSTIGISKTCLCNRGTLPREQGLHLQGLAQWLTQGRHVLLRHKSAP